MKPFEEHILRSRREFLTTAASGLGGLALAAMLGKEGLAAPAADLDKLNPLAPRPPHFKAKAKSCIFFFMAGGPSQLDLFDPKPRLNELNGRHAPKDLVKNARFAFIQADSAVLVGSPRKFARHGQCGMELSELVPNLATCTDDIALIRSMHTEPFNHHPAAMVMNSGFERMGRPTIGSWLNYGLGNESRSLPGYVVLEPVPGARGGATLWSSGFMPSSYAGMVLNNHGEPVKNLSNPEGLPPEVQRKTLDTLARLNQRRADMVGDPEIESRVASYELAFRMQKAAPELIDLKGEQPAMLEQYGVTRKDATEARFATSCLLARRMVERGVRFVNIYIDGWDHHTGLDGGIVSYCKVVDQPIAALLKDLKQRGLLDETLVVWGSEFGRTPLGDNRVGSTTVTGRDHQPSAFSMWMAGGGVKGGQVIGETDELGWNVTSDPVHVNDFHATLMHLFGLDHERLTYKFEGRDYRLTDVAGKVVSRLVA